jgi:hypothetical protein
MRTAVRRKPVKTKTRARVPHFDTRSQKDRKVALERHTPTAPMRHAVVEGQVLQRGSTASIFTREQEDIILKPSQDDELDVLPSNGALYMPHVHCRRRLTAAFRLGWRLEPKGPVTKIQQGKKASNLCQEWALYVGDYFIAQAMGFASYYESNPSMDWGDAIEGAKSNALVRCCKSINMGDLLAFDKLQSKRWREKNCVAVWCSYKGKRRLMWRRRDADPLPGEQAPASAAEIVQATAMPADEGEYEAPQRSSEPTPPPSRRSAPPPPPTRVDGNTPALVPYPGPVANQVLMSCTKVRDGDGWTLFAVGAVHSAGASEYSLFSPPKGEQPTVAFVKQLIAQRQSVRIEAVESTKAGQAGKFKIERIFAA